MLSYALSGVTARSPFTRWSLVAALQCPIKSLLMAHPLNLVAVRYIARLVRDYRFGLFFDPGGLPGPRRFRRLALRASGSIFGGRPGPLRIRVFDPGDLPGPRRLRRRLRDRPMLLRSMRFAFLRGIAYALVDKCLLAALTT